MADGEDFRTFLRTRVTDASKDVNFTPLLGPRLAQMLKDRPGITIFSGVRSQARQDQLHAEAMAKYGRDDLPGHQVAKRSQHTVGNAADLRFATAADRKWAHENAAKYGLTFPVRGEAWHVEAVGGRNKTSSTATVTPMDTGTVVDRALATIRHHESAGDYSQPGSLLGGTASGAYQITDGTWRAWAGSDIASKYPRAYMAPKEVQDAVARKQVERILQQNNGDVRAVPAYWFYPAGAKQALAGKDVQPPGKGNPTMMTYINKWMGTYQKAAGGAKFGESTVTAAKNAGAAVAPGSPVLAGLVQNALWGSVAGGGGLPQLPPLNPSQPDRPFPQAPFQALGQTNALNALMALGGKGVTGQVQVFYDPATGQAKTVPVGGSM